ncbi:MAG: hypothetical protein RL716_850, partial [Actinomycetota bacterium]
MQQTQPKKLKTKNLQTEREPTLEITASNSKRLVIVSGRAHQELAEEVATLLNT